MSEQKDPEKKTLSLSPKGTLSLKGAAPGGGMQIRQSLSQGRSQTVAVEVRRKRAGQKATEESVLETFSEQIPEDTSHLTHEEREVRLRAIQKAKEDDERRRAEEAHRRVLEAEQAKQQTHTGPSDAPKRPMTRDELRAREFAEMQLIEEEQRKKAEAERARLDQENRRPGDGFKKTTTGAAFNDEDAAEEESFRSRMKRGNARMPSTRRDDDDTSQAFKSGRLTVNQVINEMYDRDRGQSMASMRRAREKARHQSGPKELPKKISHEVTLPETISVQELANRMAERGGDVIKSLMKMGVMATINQMIDADTAELIANEFGHTVRRVTEADIETDVIGIEDVGANTTPRPPVVTIMGHVDHGKTSLLDALRATNVVAGEAGGITQHIGAYQITLPSSQKITFLDTPGHAAFSEMRARGANITDIVVLVVAANDGIMPQTIEALSHAKAANVHFIVAINKIDLHDENAAIGKQDLLQHELVLEEMGGEVLSVEVSAKKKINLDKLLETILLQAEVLDLKANPGAPARGAVVESKMEQGRGSVATILVQNGTLHVGDIFVVGSEWGRVRDIRNDLGQPIREALPGMPVEITGLTGTPNAGDSFSVVSDESQARQVSDYRSRKKRESMTVAAMGAGKSFEQLLAAAQGGGKKELAVVIKADVHGSVEAIASSLNKIAADNTEVAVRVLHTGVGAITESDITLARTSHAYVIGFNVRANAQAREQAEKNQINIRYYNIIYNIIDDVKAMLSGMLSPVDREEYLGQAEIRQVFNITKVGKVAGCMVTTGMVKRGAKVRLLRDNVVIHEGTLKTLKRMKDEVKEVREGTECGMAFENYDDIKEGDVIECFDVVQETRQLD